MYDGIPPGFAGLLSIAVRTSQRRVRPAYFSHCVTVILGGQERERGRDRGRKPFCHHWLLFFTVEEKKDTILHFLLKNEAQAVKHNRSNCLELKFENHDMVW